jgi:hypothetical protein
MDRIELYSRIIRGCPRAIVCLAEEVVEGVISRLDKNYSPMIPFIESKGETGNPTATVYTLHKCEGWGKSVAMGT